MNAEDRLTKIEVKIDNIRRIVTVSPAPDPRTLDQLNRLIMEANKLEQEIKS